MESPSYKQILIQVLRASSSIHIDDLQPLKMHSSTIFQTTNNQTKHSMKVDKIPVIEEYEPTNCSKFEQLYLIKYFGRKYPIENYLHQSDG